MTERTVIVDMQWGSCGKGQIAGSLASKSGMFDTAATAWAPNAGHTFRDSDKKYVHTMLASSAVAPSVHTILIGPGSVLNVNALLNEIVAAGDAMKGKNIIIHPNAALLLPHHSEEEQKYVRIGSTMKGSAAAVIQKMHRDPGCNNIVGHLNRDVLMSLSGLGVEIMIDEDSYNHAVKTSRHMLVEGAQGSSLSIHSRFYPYTTSRDVSVNQILADCRLPWSTPTTVIGVCRTFPIRVANRFDADGNQIGTSGGYYEDQEELDWKKDLGREPELTTVTKLPRRVFSLSREQLHESAYINNPTIMALTFCDYLLEPGQTVKIGDPIPEYVLAQMNIVQGATDAYVRLLSFGPDTSDVCGVNMENGTLTPVDGDILMPF